MKKIVKVEKIIDTVEDILCDMCGGSCKTPEDGYVNSANLSANWGYGSLQDGKSYNIDLCEKCFNKTIAALRGWRRQSGIKLTKNDPFEGFYQG